MRKYSLGTSTYVSKAEMNGWRESRIAGQEADIFWVRGRLPISIFLNTICGNIWMDRSVDRF